MAKTPLFTKQPVKQNPIEIPPEDVIGPTIPGDIAESDTELTVNGRTVPEVWDMLMAVMAGTQGLPEDVPPEVIDALAGDYPDGTPEEILIVAQEIAEAGGYDEWLAQQPPEQVGINLEDFQDIYSNDPNDENYLNPNEYMEDGTYTDPVTGTVYVINIPPDLTDTEQDDAGGGDTGGDTDDRDTGGGDVVDVTEDDTTDVIDDGADDLPSDTTEGDADSDADEEPGFSDDETPYYILM